MNPLFIALILLVFGSTGASAQTQTEALLQLDTGGHKALIRDVLVTNDKRYVVSAGDDKTIRVWDTDTKKESRKILGQIGSGQEGKIYAIALTPDAQTLAAGGFMETGLTTDADYIRLYDFPTGKLRQLLTSHTNVVNDLHFSADGRYLVSGSADNTLKVWKKEGARYVLHKTFSDHTDNVYGVRVFQAGQDIRVVSASYDDTVKLYSLRDGLLKTYDRGNDGQFLALSDTFIAVSGELDHQIHIFDHDLNLDHTITSDTFPSGLSFSPDGQWLLAGTAKHPLSANIYDTRTWQKKTAFTQHTNTVGAVAFLDNHTAITAGGTNHEIYFWDIQSAQLQGKIAGVGQRVWSVGLKDNQIAFGNTWTGDSYTVGSKFEQSFDLDQLSLSDNPQGFSRIAQHDGDYSLTHSPGGDHVFNNAVLEIQRNGATMATVTRGSSDGYRHNVYGFTEEGTILSGGSHGYLAAYNRQGEPIAQFIGHTSEVWGLAVEGERLISGSSDQTIKIWSLKHLHSAAKIYPVATLFVGSNEEWVLWTPSGYYNASLGGDKYVGFHINHGVDEAAEFYPSERFYKQFYRPDIVAATLAFGNEEQAIASVAKKTKTVIRAAETILPPTVEIVSPADGLSTNQKTVRLLATVSSASQQQVEEVVIKLNGRKLPGTRGVKVVGKAQYDLDESIELDPGANIVEVIAKHALASSNPAIVSLVYTPSQPVDLFKPDLYLLSIGVSDYQDDSRDLDYADEDALALQRIYTSQQGKFFNEVHVNLLTNQEATKSNVLDAFDWLERGVTQHDMAVVFVAGHGVNDHKDNYYFLPHDANVEKLRSTAVNWGQFNIMLADLPSKTLLLVDTCKSGNVTGSKKRGLESNITGALKDLAETESGVVVMSASTGKESSLENATWGHGAFTKALVEGMEHYKADSEGDGVITFKELDYFVSKHVKVLTGGKQHPTTQIPENMPDFPLMAR